MYTDTHIYLYSHLYTLFSPFMPLRQKEKLRPSFIGYEQRYTSLNQKLRLASTYLENTFLPQRCMGPKIHKLLSQQVFFRYNLLFHLFDITFSSFYAVSDLFYFFASLLRFLFTPLVEWPFYLFILFVQEICKEEKKNITVFRFRKQSRQIPFLFFILFYFHHIFESKLNISFYLSFFFSMLYILLKRGQVGLKALYSEKTF